ncbi:MULTISPECIES: hypothetical protein [unclassified Paraburkholderia]|nr:MULTISPECIES: hypothetical protein [unclassified Paraburkholderia]
MSNAPSLQPDCATLVEAYDRPGIRQFHTVCNGSTRFAARAA